MAIEEQEGSDLSQCALFVCNKWDQIQDKEVSKVQNHVIKRLEECWPGIDPKSQIIYMSTENASIVQSFGSVTKEFFSLMSGIKSMVLKSIEARLEMHWK